jgi:hypothetical protein
LDNDADLLSNAFELMLGTNRNAQDSDGDTLSDFDEVNFDGDFTSYNPLTDLNPLDPDTDGDGLRDDVDPAPLVPDEDEDIPFLPIWAYPLVVAGMWWARRRSSVGN